MRHAGHEALAGLESLLIEIRKYENLTEKKPGIFYRKTKAFLHFHEDPAGLFADLRIGKDWQRFPVNHPAEQYLLLTALAATNP
jgi:hypothetical protein